MSTRLEPFCERLLTLARCSSSDEALDTDVFVKLGPVNPLAAADQPPRLAFLVRRVDESRIPGKWHRDRTAVTQIDGQRVIRGGDVRSCGHDDVNRRRTHSMPP